MPLCATGVSILRLQGSLKDYLCCLQFQKETRRALYGSGQLWIRMYFQVSLCVRKQICIIRMPTTAKSSFMNDTRELQNPELKQSPKDFCIIITIILRILCGKFSCNKYLESVDDFQDQCS